jgi:hypothetical protein
MERNSDAVFGEAVHDIQRAVESTCSKCGRGAAGVAAPTLDDLEALIAIRDGFNQHRRSFSPLVEEQFRRFDSTISYLHRMIAGSKG